MSSANFHPALTKAAHAVVSDNREETRQNIELFLAENPDHPEGLLFQAWTADSLDNAYDCIQRAMDLDPNNLIAQAGMNWIQGVWNLAEEQIEADRLEQERQEQERLEQERLEQERLEAERLEAERLEQERLEQERLEQERLEAEREAQERLDREAAEAEAAAADEDNFAENNWSNAKNEHTEDEVTAENAHELAKSNEISMDFNELNQQADDDAYVVESAQPDDEEPALETNESSEPVAEEQPQEEFVDTLSPVAEEEPQEEFVDTFSPAAESPDADAADAEVNAVEAVAESTENETSGDDHDASLAHVLPSLDSEESLQDNVESLVDEVRQEVAPQPALADTPVVAEAAGFESLANVAGDETRKRVILAVDDSATIRKLVSLTLREQGYEVVTASDGVEALKILAEQLPDLILSDINMPRLGGYKLCKFVKKHERTATIPVIMLSGKDGVFDKMRGKMNGCDGFIGKPFETDELIETVNHYLPIATS